MSQKHLNIESLKKMDDAAQGVYAIPALPDKQKEYDELTKKAIEVMKAKK